MNIFFFSSRKEQNIKTSTVPYSFKCITQSYLSFFFFLILICHCVIQVHCSSKKPKSLSPFEMLQLRIAANLLEL